MSIIYPNGIGESLGDSLVTCRPLYASGNVWYVLNSTGVDAASPAGQNREKPLATLAQAITNSASNDIIVLLSGHTETMTGVGYTVSKQLTIVGAGSSGGLPTVKMGINAAATNLFIVNTSAIELRNIWFTANAQANNQPRVLVQGAGFRMVGCYLECAAFDNAAALTFSSSGTSARVVNSTFISTATSVTAQPESAIKNTGDCANLEMDGVVLSGGTVGFSNYRAMDFSGFSVTQIKAVNMSLLLGADMKLNAASTGYVNVQTATGGARVDF